MTAVGRHPTEWWVYVPDKKRRPRSADGTGTIYGPFTSRQTADAFVGRQPAGAFVMGPFVSKVKDNRPRPVRRKGGAGVKVGRRTSEQIGQEAEELRERIGFWLKELESVQANKLTAWELDFITSVSDQFGRRGTLTEKQVGILGRIYADRTA